MAALAYVLLPLSGLIAYATGASSRVRFHGLQAIIFGATWPAALFVASWISRPITQIVFVLGMLAWIALLALTATGRDPGLPGLRALLDRAAASSPGGTTATRGEGQY
jgi:uncharacterized membrane protein